MTAQDDVLRLSVNLNLTIRRARHDDLEKLEWYGQFTHFRRVFARAYKEQQQGRRLLLVADLNNFPVGRLFIQFFSHNKPLADGKHRGYFYSFYVMEILQGHGIGTRLMDIGETLLQRRGYHAATIAVARDNERALNLYLQRGYQVFGNDEGRWRYVDHSGRVQHVHEPAYLLAKNFDPR